MKLRHLTDNTCASCGARCVEETQTSKHCNGQWFESQRFECGARITWLPNYKRQEQAMECPKSEGEIMRDRATISVRKKLMQTLAELQHMDKSVLDRFISAIEGVRT